MCLWIKYSLLAAT